MGSLLATSPSVGVTRLELTSDLGDVPQLLEVGNTGLLTGPSPAVSLAQCDYGRQQLISVFSEAAPTVPLGGTFRIVFNGQHHPSQRCGVHDHERCGQLLLLCLVWVWPIC